MTQQENFENYLQEKICPPKPSKNYYENLKNQLLIKYQNKTLKDIMNCKTQTNDCGEVLKITKTQKINFKITDNNFKKQINNNLKLLPKIGLKTEENLKNKGYTTIQSLKNHDKYSNTATKFLNQIENMTYPEIINLLDNNKYSKKCRNNILKSISLTDPENFKFMDIETKGLSNVPIILIGIAEIKNNKITASQYFLRNYNEEANIIQAYLNHLDENSIHVTFNGKTFDIPFIKNRSAYNRINANLNQPHLDLMYFAKNLWSNNLPNCKLQTIEKEIFGITRIDDVPGQYIPNYWDTYQEKNNIGPIVPIIEHNAQDIISLASFLEKMYRDVN